MPPPTLVPARLHVIFARESPRAVVFRRGPSKQVASILWNRDDDTFELGQWLKGRIYDMRADVSPDGKWMIYFASDGFGQWTAISRMPYLTAHTFLPKGDCWHGGGLFLTDETYWLNELYAHEIRRETPLLRRDTTFEPSQNFGSDDRGVYFPHLIRDDWTLLGSESVGKWQERYWFERRIPGGWTLRKNFHTNANVGDEKPGQGVYFEEHELVSPDGEATPFPDWEWADHDNAGGRDRIVFAQDGKLFAIESQRLSTIAGTKELDSARELHDFNPMVFVARPAPNE